MNISNIIIELTPPSKPRKVNELLEIIPYFMNIGVRIFDIPESPLARSTVNSIVISAMIKKEYPEVKVIPHIRVIDLNQVLLRSLVLGAVYANIDHILLIRGDIPEHAIYLSKLSPIEALQTLNDLREEYSIKLGLGIDLRYKTSYIEMKIRAKPNFLMTQPVTPKHLNKLVTVRNLAHKFGVEVYPMVYITTEKNRFLLPKLGLEDVSAYDVRNLLLKLISVCGYAVVTCPLDDKYLLEYLKSFKQSLDN